MSIFNKFNIDISDDVIVNGYYESNRHTIQEQMSRKKIDGIVLIEEDHFEGFKEIIENVIRKLKIRTLPIPSSFDIDFISLLDSIKIHYLE
jgi:hypothetical protein